MLVAIPAWSSPLIMVAGYKTVVLFCNQSTLSVPKTSPEGQMEASPMELTIRNPIEETKNKSLSSRSSSKPKQMFLKDHNILF